MNKCLVLIVEGDTEIEFYRRLVQYAKKEKQGSNTKVEYINVKGFGSFKVTALRKFLNDVKPKYKNTKFTIALCRDTDVFEYGARPEIDWQAIEDAFKKNGANKVIHVKAERCIEDWFLIDAESIIKYLRLSEGTKIQGTNGVDKLSKLYKKANKVYYKGAKASDLISKIDIKKIVDEIAGELYELFEEL